MTVAPRNKAFAEEKKWPITLFMHRRVQLPKGCRATIWKQFTFKHYFPAINSVRLLSIVVDPIKKLWSNNENAMVYGFQYWFYKKQQKRLTSGWFQLTTNLPVKILVTESKLPDCQEFSEVGTSIFPDLSKKNTRHQ